MPEWVVHVTDDGTAKIVADRLVESGELANEIEPVLNRIALDMMEKTNTQFTSEGRRIGGSWKHLAPSTVLRKGHSQILVETGDLIDSLTIPDHEMQILNFEGNGFEYGTDRPWAFVHQFGSTAAKVPRRQFLLFRPDEEATWSRWLAAWILKPFRATEGEP